MFKTLKKRPAFSSAIFGTTIAKFDQPGSFKVVLQSCISVRSTIPRSISSIHGRLTSKGELNCEYWLHISVSKFMIVLVLYYPISPILFIHIWNGCRGHELSSSAWPAHRRGTFLQLSSTHPSKHQRQIYMHLLSSIVCSMALATPISEGQIVLYLYIIYIYIVHMYVYIIAPCIAPLSPVSRQKVVFLQVAIQVKLWQFCRDLCEAAYLATAYLPPARCNEALWSQKHLSPRRPGGSCPS